MGDVEEAKRRAAERAIEEVEDGMVLGLGSGSTAAHAIDLLGERVTAELDVVGVPTSHQSAQAARHAGVPVRCLADVDGIDLALDGADQVAGLDLIKGGGGAHTREKVIDTAADRFVVLVDESKLTETLDAPVPIEVMPDASPIVEDRIRAIGGEPSLRSGEATLGPTVTDNGNFVFDCDFGPLADAPAIADTLAGTPGIVDHGLFLDIADGVYVGRTNGVERYDAA